ncbi:MAG: ABC transporter permease [Patescibacteria group bacterium]|nr:ABC transporter permease [Patescibacteria group bacterium]MDD5490622.1 ABC transporter permease [Patescibacteria group bacterium]
MLSADLFKETFSALLMNKARSGLTILGIVIGIGSVIAMISVGQGATGTIESSIQALGSNLIMVTPGMQRTVGSQVRSGWGAAQSLTLADAEAIADEINTVQAVASEVAGRYQVTAKGSNTNTQVIGTTAAYPAVKNLEVGEGVFISDQNVSNTSKVAVLGPTVRDDLFGEDVNPVGQTIRIKGAEFKVIGLTVSKGGTGFSNQDDRIFIPLSTAQRFLAGNEYLTTINVEAVDQSSMSVTQEEITSLLLLRHNIADAQSADFSTMNQSDIISSASSITNTLTILLGSIAGISLVVGGIGIMNMMLTTVTERTREIGLRKAIGAKKKDIGRQFLAEAVMLTFIGGLVGIFIGWLASFIISKFGTTTEVSSLSIILAFGVSAAIGIIFGYYPARRAAGLNPIQALRFE